MSRRHVFAGLAVLVGLATGFLINLFSDLFKLDSPGDRIVAGGALLACSGVAVWLALREPPVAGRTEALDQAAQRLRDSLLQRAHEEPAWEAASDGARLPVRWLPEADGTDPVRRPGDRLAALWLDEDAERLVVLGAGGSGKSELLIGVFRTLLERWTPGARVPVLIPMTAWETSRGPADWVVAWLTANHRFLALPVPGSPFPNLAAALLQDGRLALILDGLDEIAPERHGEALRSVAGLPGTVPILLSCRTDEYLVVPPARRTAAGTRHIELQKLTTEDVLAYLTRDGDRDGAWAEVVAAMPGRAELAAVLDRPLMVMLADVTYNGDPGGDPRALLGYTDEKALSRHLLDGFVPAVYPVARSRADRWTRGQAERWLGHLARLLGPDTDLHWWELPEPRAEARTAGIRLHAGTAAVVVIWTALSAGFMYGAAFAPWNGITDAVRIASAAMISYFGVLYLTGRYRDAVLGAVGAYIAGTLSGSFDIAVGLGLVAAFAWGAAARPGRGAVRPAVLLGAVTGAVAAGIHALSAIVPLDPSLTEGFGGGAADGFTSRWDGAVPGAVASGLVAALVTLAALTFTGPRDGAAGPRRDPATLCGVATAVVVGLVCLAAERVVWTAAADGFAAGLAVWWVVHWVQLWTTGRRTGSALRAGVVVAAGYGAVAVADYTGRADMRAGWGRALSEAVAAGIVVGLARAIRPAGVPSPRRGGRWLPAVTAGVVTGALDALTGFDSSFGSAGAAAARGIATGVAVGIVVLVLTERLRHPHVDTEPGRIAPLETAVFVMALVGLLAGFAWALMYGLIAGLGCRVARDIALRKQPSMNLLPSGRGAVVGALLGTVAVFAAAYNGTSPVWLLAIWATSAAAGAFAFGFEGADPKNLPAASPRRLFVRDRAGFVIITTVLALALGGAFAARTLADGHPVGIAVFAGVSTLCTYGLTAGVVIAAATSRYLTYTVTRSRHARHGDLPWNLMSFLDDAHRTRRALRTAGTAYQFRHQDLKERIAAASRPV